MKIKIIRKKIKNTYIKIDDEDTVVITTNKKLSNKQINEILESKKKWIEKQLAKIPNIPYSLDKQKIQILGEIYFINIVKSSTNNVYIDENKLIVETTNEDLGYICNLIETYLKEYFYSILDELTNECIKKAKKYNITFDGNFKLRKMKTRFGSISKVTNTIYLNTLLIKYDIETIKSVIYHELCHTKQMNHQKNFYNLLYKLCPNYNILSKDMKNDFVFNDFWFVVK